MYDLSRNEASAFHSSQPVPVSPLGEPSSLTVRVSHQLRKSFHARLIPGSMLSKSIFFFDP